MYWFIKVLLYLPTKLIYPTKVEGKENLIKGKCILTANHQSLVDPGIIAANINTKVHFLAKNELFKSKLSKWFFNGINVIPVKRGQMDVGAVKKVLKILKNNQTIGIFPGGTRNKNFEQEEDLKNGASMFAIKSNAPIIPIIFLNKPKKFKRNKIIIGEPIYFEKPKGKLTKNYLNKCTLILERELNRYKKQHTVLKAPEELSVELKDNKHSNYIDNKINKLSLNEDQHDKYEL